MTVQSQPLNGEQGDALMPPDLVAGLKAASEELRACNCDDPTQPFGNCLRHAFAPGDADALATLIDGMLEQHERWFNEDYPQIAATCEPCGDYWPCPSLRLLAIYVSTVLGRDLNG